MWQAKHALLMWHTGEFVKPSGTGTGSADEWFLHANWGQKSEEYMKSITKMTWRNWGKVILQATNISMPEHQYNTASVGSMAAGIARARALCVDEDSDNNVW